MEKEAASTGAIVGAGTPESPQPATSRWRNISGKTFARFGGAAILLIAAALKMYQLFTDPALGVLYGSRWLQAGLVEYELLLAIWLLFGVVLHWARRVALVTFIGFGCYAFYLGVAGEASCGCFGRAQVSPWWTFILDAALVLSLLVWKPAPGRTVFGAGPGFVRCARVPASLAIAAVFAVTSVLLLSAATWRPESASADTDSFANSRFVLLEPEKWIGKPFPLTDYIDMSERERLSRGSWVVVFYHHDCPKCQKALPQYERLAEKLKNANEGVEIALIEVPAHGTGERLVCQFSHLGRLRDGKEWLITTPAEVRLADGQVTAATSDEASLLVEARPATQLP